MIVIICLNSPIGYHINILNFYKKVKNFNFCHDSLLLLYYIKYYSNKKLYLLNLLHILYDYIAFLIYIWNCII